MGFVNENIDTPERIREFAQLDLVSPITHKPLKPWRWAVDRSRGYYFVSFGGGALQVPFMFALVAPGGKVDIEGDSDEHGVLSARNIEVEWRISRVRIPQSLASQADELLAVVREALDMHGVSFDRTPVKTVTITLPPPTIV